MQSKKAEIAAVPMVGGTGTLLSIGGSTLALTGVGFAVATVATGLAVGGVIDEEVLVATRDISKNDREKIANIASNNKRANEYLLKSNKNISDMKSVDELLELNQIVNEETADKIQNINQFIDLKNPGIYSKNLSSDFIKNMISFGGYDNKILAYEIARHDFLSQVYAAQGLNKLILINKIENLCPNLSQLDSAIYKQSKIQDSSKKIAPYTAAPAQKDENLGTH